MYSNSHYRADARFPGTPLFAVALLVFSILATPLRAMLGNYTRSVILTVAASNSSADLQAEADYLCTGTNDQTQIQAALNALPSNGGRVVLLEGTYNIFATIRIEKDSTTLEGQGVKLSEPVELALGQVVAADEDDVLAAPLRRDGREVAAGEEQRKCHQGCGNAGAQADAESAGAESAGAEPAGGRGPATRRSRRGRAD